MAKEIIKKIRKQIKEMSHSEKNSFKNAFENHITDVVKYAKQLAKNQNADIEICELAALLHDSGSFIGKHENHHIVSSEIAEKLLTQLNYPKQKIKQIKHCILNHRASIKGNPETPEAQILIDADSMAHFDEIDFLINGMYYGAKTRQESKKKILEKLERSYKKLSSQGKILIKPKLIQARKKLK